MTGWRYLHVLWVVGFACSFELDLEENAARPTIAFEYTNSGADELSGTVMIPVILTTASTVEVRVKYSLLGGSGAVLGSDFDLTPGTLVFAPGEQRKEIAVTIRNDADMTEMVESFDIALSEPVGAPLDELRAIHSVRISDHILPRVQIGPAPTSTTEGAPTMLTVTLDKGSEGTSTVVVGVAGGPTAPINGNDITLTDGTVVTFSNGETSKTVAIGERDDTLDEEDNEYAVFTLRGASENLVLGASKTVTHAIADNDNMPIVRFNNATSSNGENGILSTITVSLNTASGRTVTVDWIRNGNDTADNADATAVGSPGTFTFDPGQTNKTITVLLINDDIDEDNETVLLDLSNPVNATLGTATHTLTINDNDTSNASFQNSTSTVAESAAGGVSITVRLSTPSSKMVSVPFSRTGGSASSDDYTINTQSPLVFMPGETMKMIDIDVPENPPGNEGNETVQIDIGTPTNAGRQNPTRHTLTITE